ncbi:hypothetical protein M8J75_015662 [Diaphorina citri]|nr:hypothetical protein M8J75_015662 [Diaphorina citri]
MTSNTTTNTVTTTVTTPIISTESVYNASPVPFRTFQQRVDNRLDSMNGGCRSYYNSTSFPGPSGGNEVPPVNSFNLRPIPDHPMRQPSSFNYNVHYDPAPASSHFIFNENPAPVGNQQRYSDSAPARSFNNHPVQPCERELRSNDGIPPAQCYSPPPPSPPNPVADIQVSSGASNLPAPPAIPGTSKQYPLQSNTVDLKPSSLVTASQVSCDTTVNLIQIPATLRRYKLDAILDSGSSGNLIHSDFVKQTDLQPAPYEGFLAGTQGTLHITGKTSVDLMVNQHSYMVNFFVSPDLRQDAILGQPFLTQVGAILDYSRCKVTLSHPTENTIYWKESLSAEDIPATTGVSTEPPDPKNLESPDPIHRTPKVFHVGITDLFVPTPHKADPPPSVPHRRDIPGITVRKRRAHSRPKPRFWTKPRVQHIPVVANRADRANNRHSDNQTHTHTHSYVSSDTWGHFAPGRPPEMGRNRLRLQSPLPEINSPRAATSFPFNRATGHSRPQYKSS